MVNSVIAKTIISENSKFCIACGYKNENILKKNQNIKHLSTLVFRMQIRNYYSHLNSNVKVMTKWFQTKFW